MAAVPTTDSARGHFRLGGQDFTHQLQRPCSHRGALACCTSRRRSANAVTKRGEQESCKDAMAITFFGCWSGQWGSLTENKSANVHLCRRAWLCKEDWCAPVLGHAPWRRKQRIIARETPHSNPSPSVRISRTHSRVIAWRCWAIAANQHVGVGDATARGPLQTRARHAFTATTSPRPTQAPMRSHDHGAPVPAGDHGCACLFSGASEAAPILMVCLHR